MKSSSHLDKVTVARIVYILEVQGEGKDERTGGREKARKYGVHTGTDKQINYLVTLIQIDVLRISIKL